MISSHSWGLENINIQHKVHIRETMITLNIELTQDSEPGSVTVVQPRANYFIILNFIYSLEKIYPYFKDLLLGPHRIMGIPRASLTL